jgi:hypothetical protein
MVLLSDEGDRGHQVTATPVRVGPDRVEAGGGASDDPAGAEKDQRRKELEPGEHRPYYTTRARRWLTSLTVSIEVMA